MKPISHERVEFLQERYKVVNEMINILQANTRTMQPSAMNVSHEVMQALAAAKAERISIEVELRVLRDKFQVQP